MKRVAKVLAAVVIASLSTQASAACKCTCVNAQIEAVCTSQTDLPPVCAPRTCTVKPLRAGLVNQASVAASTSGSTKQCHETQVLNPQTGSYVSKQVCR
jgi:hypothetical protein